MSRLSAFLLAVGMSACADTSPALRLATTTSVDDSGLMDHLGRLFRQESGVRLDVIAVGSGKALALLERGDVTCVITHAPEAERAVAGRTGALRREVFANQFVIVGPMNGSLREGPFSSRGDGSGTHIREIRLWDELGWRPARYVETGRGMAHTLDYSFEKGAFTLTDTATLAVYPKRDRFTRHQVIGRNIYSILALPEDPAARAFLDWLVSGEGREAVASYRVRSKSVFESP